MLVPSEKLIAYGSATTKLEELERQEGQLLLTYKESHPLVQDVRSRIGKVTRQKADLEQQYPGLVHYLAGPGRRGTNTVNPRLGESAQADFQLQPAEIDPAKP